MNDQPTRDVLSDIERDAIYTQLCQTLTEVGETRSTLMLARLALLLMERLGDAPAAAALIEDAASDLRAQDGEHSMVVAQSCSSAGSRAHPPWATHP